MLSDGAGNDVPVVDNVVGLQFDYYGEALPPMVRRSLSNVPATTYGPAPSDVAAAPWDAFENCIFASGAVPSPKLPVLGGGTPGLVPLTAAELTDGPFCPDDSEPEPLGRGPPADPEDRRHVARPDGRCGAARACGRAVQAWRHVGRRIQVGAGSRGALRDFPAQPQSREVTHGHPP